MPPPRPAPDTGPLEPGATGPGNTGPQQPVPGGIGALRFTRRFVDFLPGDADPSRAPRQVHGAAYSPVTPTPVRDPRVIAHSRDVAALLGLTSADISGSRFATVFGGNDVLPGMAPYAACYGGHQFGNWAGQLGDGRAIVLGEVAGTDGGSWTLQLKGAGPTPYSRGADGRAVLRSSIREFLCSEAMHHLGVPTTRALSLVVTGDEVVRDMLYDGNPAAEPGAIVTRVARSFVRFGSFELPASRGDLGLLRAVTDHVIASDFAHLTAGAPPPDGGYGSDVYEAFFAEVVRTTADLITHWMRVGFVHGVMNTDNMSILGETIDYGPYGWIDDYDPNWTPNTTDAATRRYRFGNQPRVAQWNLAQLASALVPLTGRVEGLQDALDAYGAVSTESLDRMYAAKLGLSDFRDELGDRQLIDDLNGLLAAAETDMTVFYRRLATLDLDRPVAGAGLPGSTVGDAGRDMAAMALAPEALGAAYYRPEQIDGELIERFGRWFDRYRHRLDATGVGETERSDLMNRTNPAYVLRNYLAQDAIDRAYAGDFGGVEALQELMRHPYDERHENERFAGLRPDWARTRVGCSTLSCSS